MYLNKLFEAAEDGTLTIHCPKIQIFQRKTPGLNLCGYGTIRINNPGTIHLEFICTNAENIKHQSVDVQYPEDPFDPEQALFLEAESLEGKILKSENFNLHKRTFLFSPPELLHLFLHEIYFETVECQPESPSYIYFEYKERLSIPKNKKNTITYSNGGESQAWNQADIQTEDWNVSVVDEKTKVTVRAWGEFITSEMEDALLFYLGFTAGSIPQPYAMITRTGTHSRTTIRTINKKYRNYEFPQPFPELTDQGHTTHHALLKEIFRVAKTNKTYFSTIKTQWVRLWHAFNSENSVATLTLGVAIEAILNDIFTPTLTQQNTDSAFESKKLELIKKIEKLEVDKDQIKYLSDTIKNWGKLTPRKALLKLSELKVINKNQIQDWQNLRNSAAHPRHIDNLEERQSKDYRRLAECINLFYRLSLNVFSYNGPCYEFGGPGEHTLKSYPYVNVLYEEASQD